MRNARPTLSCKLFNNEFRRNQPYRIPESGRMPGEPKQRRRCSCAENEVSWCPMELQYFGLKIVSFVTAKRHRFVRPNSLGTCRSTVKLEWPVSLHCGRWRISPGQTTEGRLAPVTRHRRMWLSSTNPGASHNSMALLQRGRHPRIRLGETWTRPDNIPWLQRFAIGSKPLFVMP